MRSPSRPSPWTRTAARSTPPPSPTPHPNPFPLQIAYSWAPASVSFNRPHILRASPDCASVYVGEIAGSQGTVWRFDVLSDSPSIATKAKPKASG